MAFTKIKSKSFKLKKEASEWAKDQKKKQPKVKWETNRTKNPDRPWEAIIFKDIK